MIKCAQGRRVRLSQSLLEKLIIIDDGMSTYNAYKNNTIRVTQWTKQMRNDRVLLDV